MAVFDKDSRCTLVANVLWRASVLGTASWWHRNPLTTSGLSPALGVSCSPRVDRFCLSRGSPAPFTFQLENAATNRHRYNESIKERLREKFRQRSRSRQAFYVHHHPIGVRGRKETCVCIADVQGAPFVVARLVCYSRADTRGEEKERGGGTNQTLRMVWCGILSALT